MASQPKLSHCQNPDSVITDHSLVMETTTEMKMRRTTMNRKMTRMRMNRRKLLMNVCGESCVSCQLRVVLFPSLPITAPLFHCSPCPSLLTRILGLTGSRPTTAPSNNLPLPTFHPMSSLFAHVTKNNQTCLWSNGRCPTFIILSADIPFSQVSFHPLDSLINQKLLFTAFASA